jgi:hypothetical protein
MRAVAGAVVCLAGAVVFSAGAVGSAICTAAQRPYQAGEAIMFAGAILGLVGIGLGVSLTRPREGE